MTAAPLPRVYVGECRTEGCDNDVYRRTMSGAAPTRCDTCRRENFKGGRTRGNAKNEPGATLQIRALLRNATEETRLPLVGVAISAATGIPEAIAESIASAIDTLLEHGETDVDIRRRLNPTTTQRQQLGQRTENLREFLKGEFG
jgi:hypothetical protein